jgi:hypothetical protein
VTVLKPILIEGYTAEEILGLPPEQFKTFVFTGKPLVFKAGSAQILGEFDLRDNRLVIGEPSVSKLGTSNRMSNQYAEGLRRNLLIGESTR